MANQIVHERNQEPNVVVIPSISLIINLSLRTPTVLALPFVFVRAGIISGLLSLSVATILTLLIYYVIIRATTISEKWQTTVKNILRFVIFIKIILLAQMYAECLYDIVTMCIGYTSADDRYLVVILVTSFEMSIYMFGMGGLIELEWLCFVSNIIYGMLISFVSLMFFARLGFGGT
jgi:hypothetical protein